jgi:hypothetical protein
LGVVGSTIARRHKLGEIVRIEFRRRGGLGLRLHEAAILVVASLFPDIPFQRLFEIAGGLGQNRQRPLHVLSPHQDFYPA